MENHSAETALIAATVDICMILDRRHGSPHSPGSHHFQNQCIIYKTITTSTSPYLADKVTISVQGTIAAKRPSDCRLRSAKKEKTKQQAISICAPRIWNNIPISIRNAPTLLQFRKEFKMHFLKNTASQCTTCPQTGDLSINC